MVLNGWVTTVATATFAASLALVAIISLLICLIQKEVFSAFSNDGAKAMSSVLNIAIVPFTLSFLFIVVVKVAEVLRWILNWHSLALSKKATSARRSFLYF